MTTMIWVLALLVHLPNGSTVTGFRDHPLDADKFAAFRTEASCNAQLASDRPLIQKEIGHLKYQLECRPVDRQQFEAKQGFPTMDAGAGA